MGPMYLSVQVKMTMGLLDELSDAAKRHGWSLDEEITARLMGTAPDGIEERVKRLEAKADV